jgi:hypothetical protein
MVKSMQQNAYLKTEFLLYGAELMGSDRMIFGILVHPETEQPLSLGTFHSPSAILRLPTE